VIDAPPIRNPSTSAKEMSDSAFVSLTDPP